MRRYLIQFFSLRSYSLSLSLLTVLLVGETTIDLFFFPLRVSFEKNAEHNICHARLNIIYRKRQER